MHCARNIVGQSVCFSVVHDHDPCTKTTEPTEMTFGCLTHVSQGANIRWWLELDGAGAESVVCEIKQI